MLILINIGIVNALTDNNPSNNKKNVAVSVVETQSMSVKFIPVDEPQFFVTSKNLYTDFISKIYPISDTDLIVKSGASTNTSTIERLFLDLLLLRLSKEALISGDVNKVVGILPINWFLDNGFGSGTQGLAIKPHQSVLVEERRVRYLAAHELGHTFGLCDEHNSIIWKLQDIPLIGRCPNGDLDNNSFLDPICTPQGCPTSTIGLLHPIPTTDEIAPFNNFMGNGPESKAWISTESYNHLLEKFTREPTEADTVIIVSGSFLLNTSETILDNTYILGKRTLTTQDDIIPGNLTIELRDNSDNLITNLSFRPSGLLNLFNESLIETDHTSFIFVMNFTPDLSKIIIKDKSITRVEQIRTANTPSLSLLFPTGGELISQQMTIEYDATDADNDIINYAILISDDNGATFTTLVVDHPDKTFFLDTTPFPDGDQYKIKILATDGINTDTAISGAFTINNTIQPTLTIPFTVFAFNSVLLRNKAQVFGSVGARDKSPGPVLKTNSEVTLEGKSRVTEDVFGDTVTLKPKAVIEAFVHFNELFEGRKSKILGQKITPLDLPVNAEIPIFPTFSIGTQDIKVTFGKTTNLAPGNYDDIKVGIKGTLILKGGIFNFDNLELSYFSNIICAPVAPENDCEIRIKNRLKSKSKSFIGPSTTTSLTPKDFRIFVAGINGKTGTLKAKPKAVELGSKTQVRSRLFAPDGTIKIKSKVSVDGRVIGKDVDVGSKAMVREG